MMLRRLRKNLRVKAAIALAVLYALCVLTPAAALALNGPAAVHCLTEHGLAAPSHHAIKSHVHADGTVHADHDRTAAQHPETGSKGHPGDCCGLFCMSALVLDVANVPLTQIQFSPSFSTLDANLAGRGPERINRPPIA